jgi:hypothetical protein
MASTTITVEGLTPDDVHVRPHPQGVITQLGPICLWEPSLDVLHDLWVDMGRKIAHATIHSYPGIDPTQDDR